MAQLQSTGITGSLTVTTGSATEFQVLNTGVRIGSVISDAHTVTGSIDITGSLNVLGIVTMSASPSGDGNVLLVRNNNPSGNTNSVIALDTIASGGVGDIRLGSANPTGIRIYASEVGLTASPSGSGFQFFKNTHPTFPGTIFFDSGANNNAAIIFRTAITAGTITERMRIASGGNVGIGTTSPTLALLQVQGTISATGAVTSSGTFNSTGGGFVTSGGNVGVGALTPLARIHISASAASLLRVDGTTSTVLLVSGSGNVGIGTLTPTVALLQVQGNVSASSYTGSLFGTASRADNATSSSFSTTAVSASFATNAVSASFINTLNQSVIITGSVNVTGSVTATTFTGSLLGTASRADNATSASFASTAVSASFASTSVSASFATNAVSASFATNAVSASFATQANTSFTASSADNFTVRGTLTAQTIVAQTITSSTDFVTGSTRFGSLMSNTHQFTGSVSITGSLNVVGTGITGSLLGTASRADNATSASFASTAVSASFASTAASASFSTTAVSASFASTAVSASFATNAVSASFAPTATNVYIQGGNSFGTTALLGTNDVQDLQFETSGSVRMLISGSSGFVGIGTTIPLSRFHVRATTNQNFRVSAGTNLEVASINDADSAYSSLTFRASNFDFQNGNVGIGTTSPAFRLDVSGSARMLGGSVYLGQALTASGHLNAYELMTFNIDVDNNDSNRYFAWYTNAADGAGTELMRLTEAGSVGIGTTSPQSKLEVGGIGSNGTPDYGALTLSSGSSGLTLGWDSTNNRSYIYSRTSGITSRPLEINGTMYVIGFGNVGIGVTSPVAKLHLSGSNTDAIFRINSPVSSSILVVSGSGNVGIGTASPDTLLNIYGTAEKAYLNVNAIAGFAGIGSGSGAMVYFNNNGDGNNILIRTNNSARTDAAPFAVWTENNSRFIILNNGNIGIGTSAPVNKLQVAGGGVQIGNAATTTIDLRLTRTNGGITADAHYFVATANTPNHSWIEGGYMTNELAGVVTSPNSGYPYIENYAGQGSATTKTFGFVNKTTGSFTSTDITSSLGLSRTGQISFYQYKTTSSFTGTVVGFLGFDSSGNILTTTGSGGGASLSGGATNYVARWASATTLTTGSIFDNGTNVGIGTTNPSYLLDVYGLSTTTLRIRGGSSGYTQGALLFQSSTTDSPQSRGLGAYTFNEGTDATWFFGNGYGYGDYFVINRKTGSAFDISAAAPAESSNFLSINNVGNVGIGSAIPTALLNVSSSTAATIFRVDTAGGAGTLFVSGSGNVGIGTSTPLARLDVEGNLLVRNAQFEATSSATSGSTIIATIATGSYRAAFVDYVAFSGSNQRAGTFISNWNGSSVQFTDYSTLDIGTTSTVTMSAVISGGNALIQATTPISWTVTATYRTI